MSIKSMTGFARGDGVFGSVSWHWEVRSVNGRGLDLRFRLPSGFEALEPRLRDAIGSRFVRGSISINLNIKRTEGELDVRLNETVLAKVVAAADRVRAQSGASAPSADGLLALRGVLETVEPQETDAETASRTAALLVSFARALDGVGEARSAEGSRLQGSLGDQLCAIERHIAAAEKVAARVPEAVQRRLEDQLGKLLDASPALDAVRLHQEAALLAVRADVDEELQRLKAHTAAARELFRSSEPVGRRFDFLTQELNREANTLCSKSSDIELTRIGLELKAVIDQIREQVQNIE
jgi:uncharacterized protein (TIGR00255 family)